jgi:HSP20 family protein
MLPVLQTNGVARSTAEPVNRLSTVLDQLFDDHFFSPLAAPQAIASTPMAIWEDENSYHIEMDAPGMTENDIDISIQNGDLIIRGERRRERNEHGYDTRNYGRFEQRISLPTGARAETADAKLTKGVLSLTFPKGEEAKPRRIIIQGD